MPDQNSDSSPAITTSIYLDYGADEHDCTNEGFEICERGMRFHTRWQFSLGTQLAVAFAYHDSEGVKHRVTTEGIIVDCAHVAGKCYQSTLLFLELPESLRAVVRNANPRLEASVANEGHVRTIRPKAGLN